MQHEGASGNLPRNSHTLDALTYQAEHLPIKFVHLQQYHDSNQISRQYQIKYLIIQT